MNVNLGATVLLHAALVLPSFVPALAILLAICPFPVGISAVEFEISNDTTESIIITPIGRSTEVRGKDKRVPLALFTPYPNFHLEQRRGFRVPPHETLRLHCDFDDIRPSEVIIEDGSGPLHQVSVTNRFSSLISPRTTRDPVTEDVREAWVAAATPHPLAGLSWWWALSFLPWVTLGIVARAMYRGRHRNRSRSGTRSPDLDEPPMAPQA